MNSYNLDAVTQKGISCAYWDLIGVLQSLQDGKPEDIDRKAVWHSIRDLYLIDPDMFEKQGDPYWKLVKDERTDDKVIG
jgi:hypothetical protein